MNALIRKKVYPYAFCWMQPFQFLLFGFVQSQFLMIVSALIAVLCFMICCYLAILKGDNFQTIFVWAGLVTIGIGISLGLILSPLMLLVGN